MSSRRSLIAIGDLSRDEVGRTLDLAERFSEVMRRDIKKVPTLRGRTVINMFFESSTRTATSFELAGKRLSADVINIKGRGSSVDKGETLKDTVLTLDAYRPDILVIRHSAAGACAAARRYTSAAVVNAGDGKHEHPTPALLDLYTLRRATGRLDGLHVAFVGDVLHSRVARSGAIALRTMGARVSFVAPPTLLPRDAAEGLGAEVSWDIRDIADADVVYALRMQHERMGRGGFVPSLREYATQYGIGHHRLRPGQLVMHAGPMNRGVEITDELADDPTALITTQVESGMVVRMAVMYDLLTEPSAQRTAEPLAEAVAA
jgi:aspartate carbamoyltransferase catalytic subunit